MADIHLEDADSTDDDCNMVNCFIESGSLEWNPNCSMVHCSMEVLKFYIRCTVNPDWNPYCYEGFIQDLHIMSHPHRKKAKHTYRNCGPVRVYIDIQFYYPHRTMNNTAICDVNLEWNSICGTGSLFYEGRDMHFAFFFAMCKPQTKPELWRGLLIFINCSMGTGYFISYRPWMKSLRCSSLAKPFVRNVVHGNSGYESHKMPQNATKRDQHSPRIAYKTFRKCRKGVFLHHTKMDVKSRHGETQGK